jgi:flagellar basal-body rod protein FlgB
LQAASLALKGLSARQEVIGNNIANVDTPGYNAQQIDFETTLARTLNQSTTKVGMAKTSEFHLDSATTNSEFLAKSNREGGAYREDGNNVDIDTELIDMSETNLKYQAISQWLSSKLLLLKSIAQGG